MLFFYIYISITIMYYYVFCSIHKLLQIIMYFVYSKTKIMNGELKLVMGKSSWRFFSKIKVFFLEY